MRRAVTLLSLLPLLPFGAAAQVMADAQPIDPGPAPSATERLARRLPSELLGYRRISETEALRRGSTVRYAATDGERIMVSVMVYASEGSGTPEEELQRASAETEALAGTGRYRAVTAQALPPAATPALAEATPALRCTSFTLQPQQGRASADGICVALQSGHVVKVRVNSLSQPDAGRAGRMAAEMAEAVGQVFASAR
ncbi:hypothetical protein BKE38_20160 [Pseudoroseomonas deserti]|uniref:Uncharacterized protein n=1 Tax=Teichococcus deserti TaxID=1817963 RepID=A0A1V2GXX9_9PROT|nr:hypothetical protein [Pseudoroseomonas deserti]ONG49960.1 hypothetical protein BKE38_20160 [Pseudoroseomonas deserti]